MRNVITLTYGKVQNTMYKDNLQLAIDDMRLVQRGW